MGYDIIINKALENEPLHFAEAQKLYFKLPTSELMLIAQTIRNRIKHGKIVSWIIDRNVNISNICSSGCEFCSFYCSGGSENKAFITSIDEYKVKIDELFRLGGQQLLLQGGMHPDFRLKYYENLFKELKTLYPALKLHALGPPEIFYLSIIEKTSIRKVLKCLIEAGLDSLPGAGAEILVDRVRKIVSPKKCNSQQWLNVMKEAHKLGLPTTATMMFGHLETPAERISHLFKIKQVQNQKPNPAIGFTAFIPWTFQSANTALIKKYPDIKKIKTDEYLRTIAISRIVLQNIDNIQASWLTMGSDTAQLALWAGANDLGSIMIEENVVASSGVTNKMNSQEIQKLIIDAGFEPMQRNQKYEYQNM
ncbi:MAG: dehypoxanthine futalosine cyclase [Bacteroidales bacterium]|nr:dehypoxanthine futalosine cyclase [Bacteroidales bacterium]